MLASWRACIILYGNTRHLTVVLQYSLYTTHAFFLEDQRKQEFALSLQQHINCVEFSVNFLRLVVETVPCVMRISNVSRTPPLAPRLWRFIVQPNAVCCFCNHMTCGNTPYQKLKKKKAILLCNLNEISWCLS